MYIIYKCTKKSAFASNCINLLALINAYKHIM